MSNVQEVTQPNKAAPLAANQAIIRGRIVEVKRTENACYTDVVLPAPDQYSSPQNVRIVSTRLLGKPNEDITQRVTIKGYRRAYTDKTTGQRAYACDIALSAIED